MLVIDIGCGRDKINRPDAEVIGIDKFDLEGVDIVLDLENDKLPFDDNSVDKAYATHFLEHLSDIVHIIEEVWRVLKPNGKFIVTVPHFSSCHAYMPVHKLYFGLGSFNTFLDYSDKRTDNWYSKAKFKIRKRELRFFAQRSKFKSFDKILNPLINIFPNFYEWLKLPCAEVYFELEVIK